MSRLLYFCLFYFSINIIAIGQNESSQFSIIGNVAVEQGVVDECNVLVYRNNSMIQRLSLGRIGSFRISLDLNQFYQLKFQKEGYYSKTVDINTKVPDSVFKLNPVFPPYQLRIMLFNSIPGYDTLYSEKSSGLISYNARIDNFDTKVLVKDKEIQNLIQQALVASRERSKKDIEARKRSDQLLYNRLIVEADNSLRNQAFDEALKKYNDAHNLFPAELYPIGKIDEVYVSFSKEQLVKLFGEPTESNYLKFLSYGEKYFNENEFTKAKAAFELAKFVKPNEAYISERLALSNKKIIDMRSELTNESLHKVSVNIEREKKYKELTDSADIAFQAQQFAKAKDLYARAASLVKTNDHARYMLAKIEDLLSNNDAALAMAQQKEEAERKRLLELRTKAYSSAIELADSLFNAMQYNDALENYEFALSIKTYEQYPKIQITRIKNIIADLALKGEKYKALIASADNYLKGSNLKAARADYVSAHNLIPDESYAQLKVEWIDKQQTVAQKNQSYSDLIVSADKLFSDKEYEGALEKYTNALSLKPNEPYPQKRIIQINAILESLRKMSDEERQNYAKYLESIAIADSLFESRDFIISKENYLIAMKLRTEESYPKLQIAKINQLLNDSLARKKDDDELSKRYDKLILSGDLAFDQKFYDDAIMNFSDARKLKPKEIYPAERIKAIEQLKAEALKANENGKAYNQHIEYADKFFTSGNLTDAKENYLRALNLKPDEKYPRQQIAEIEKRIAESQKVVEVAPKIDEYAENIKLADIAFRQKRYDEARIKYVDALKVKSGQAYPLDQIKYIDKVLSDAKAKSQPKIEVVETEATPSEDPLLVYNEAMKQGEGYMLQQEWGVARYYFLKALGAKPNDKIANAKLLLISKNIKEGKNSGSRYAELVNLGDKAFESGDFSVSRIHYLKALDIKSGDKYVQERIALLEKLVSTGNSRASNAEYNESIKKANDAMSGGNLAVARFYFRKALSLKSDDQYSQTQLYKIDSMLRSK